jgi:hypothetical protein
MAREIKFEILRQQKNDDFVISLPEMVPVRSLRRFRLNVLGRRRCRQPAPFWFAKSKRVTWSFLLSEKDSQSKNHLR